MKSIFFFRISIIDYLHKVNWHYYLKYGYFCNLENLFMNEMSYFQNVDSTIRNESLEKLGVQFLPFLLVNFY